jgi:glycosyltransferase involved in cell wall biosynthesis
MDIFCVAELFDLKDLPLVRAGRVNAIVICFNEDLRLPQFLEFYRSLGVDHFVFIDNGSTDRSGEILDAHPLVTRLYTTRSYGQHKAIWREALANQFFAHRWVLFPDVDEFLIYPGWPDRDLQSFVSYLEAYGYDALFTSMVDMYPLQPLSGLDYKPGDSLIDTCPYFDTGNYRLIPRIAKRWQTPHYSLYGGARERLFHPGKQRESSWVDQLLLRIFFSLKRNDCPDPKRQRWERRALEWLDGCLPEKPPNMSKVPLLRWRPGTRISGGPHRLNFEYRVAPDWGALLHFKYLQDFAHKVEHSVKRGEHEKGSAHYKIYQSRLHDLRTQSMGFKGSKKFEGYRSLLKAGLLRESEALRGECET